jgi:membrane fusion protein (multidrug efflux system)
MPLSPPIKAMRSVGTALLVTAALALAGCGSASEGKDRKGTPEGGFIIAAPTSVPIEIELPGRTSPFELSEVRPQVSGVIRSRQFTEGSIVRAGQTLYQIDASAYSASAAQARANLESAQAARAAADARARRVASLAKKDFASAQTNIDAQTAARQARAAVNQSAAALEGANVNLRFTRVPAPISGRIGRSSVTTGALVTANQAEAMTTIQRLDPIYVDVQQSSADLLRLRNAIRSGGASAARTQVRLTLDDGSDYGLTGTLQFTEALVDPATGSVTLRAVFPNPQGVLLPGMFVRAKLAQQTLANIFLIPQSAVSRDPKGSATVLLVAGDKARRQTVNATRTYGDQWIVTAGLKPGDKVIVEGLGKVKEGQKLIAVPAGSPPRPAPRPARA